MTNTNNLQFNVQDREFYVSKTRTETEDITTLYWYYNAPIELYSIEQNDFDSCTVNSRYLSEEEKEIISLYLGYYGNDDDFIESVTKFNFDFEYIALDNKDKIFQEMANNDIVTDTIDNRELQYLFIKDSNGINTYQSKLGFLYCLNDGTKEYIHVADIYTFNNVANVYCNDRIRNKSNTIKFTTFKDLINQVVNDFLKWQVIDETVNNHYNKVNTN